MCVCAITLELLSLADVTNFHANLSVTFMFVFEGYEASNCVGHP
jgi:hypothetical protein